MQRILTVNCGSSSLKFHVFAVEGKSTAPRMLCAAEAERIGQQGGVFSFSDAQDATRSRREDVTFPDHGSALDHGLDLLEALGIARDYDAVAHRFVHGGPSLREHQPLTPEVLEKIKAAIPFAQLHLPAAIDAVEAMQERYGDSRQFACFDTAFHRTLPEVAAQFALPEEVTALGVRRYGFHGLSLESILDQLDPVPARLIVAHLGNGSSVTAIRDGRSIDTSMGLTPTGGMMMGTRSGDLDPGVLLFLLRRGGYGHDQLEILLEHKAGLLGVSGRTSDMRELLAQRATDPKCAAALEMYTYQAAQQIARMAVALGGADLLVFTGGIGEHATQVREEITERVAFLDIKTQTAPAQEDLRMARIVQNSFKN